MISISQAKKDDGPSIVKLEQEVWQEDNVSNVYEMAAFIRHGFVYVAKEYDCIIGALVSFVTKDGEIYVVDIVIHPDHRNKHIASRLYQRLLKDTKDPVIALVSPDYHASLQLHEKIGFQKIKTVNRPYSIDNKNEKMIIYRLDR